MRPVRPRTLAYAALVLLLLTGAGAALFVYSGIYNVSALKQHTQPVYRIVHLAMRYSVQRRADEIEVPDLQQANWRTGLTLYEGHCRRCHGAPGVAPDHFALGMKPVPTAMVEAARKRSPAELFWTIEHGVKMTGMPAWRYRLTDREIWEIVAFLQRMPYLTVPEYARLRATADVANRPHSHNQGADRRTAPDDTIERGRIAMQQYGCISCHVIPGVTGAKKEVGPSLAGIASRSYIAGVLPNTTENMVRWLRFPQEVDPLTAMPPLGVNEQDARDMAAYLKQLREVGSMLPVKVETAGSAPLN